MISRGIFLCVLISGCIIGIECQAKQAIAHLVSANISGSITFTETDTGVRVTGTIIGLPTGNYGFHVHELGDISTCDATAAHFNPDATVHGGPDHEVRHVGDLGNVRFEGNVATINIEDRLITLTGRNSILGRGLVLHAEEDDLGLGGHANSLTTGNAGARVACGVIGLLAPSDPWHDETASSAPGIIKPYLTVLSLSAFFVKAILS